MSGWRLAAHLVDGKAHKIYAARPVQLTTEAKTAMLIFIETRSQRGPIDMGPQRGEWIADLPTQDWGGENPMTTLDQLKPGASGRIVSIDGADGIASRLRELGFIPGAAVRAMRPAPFGDPLKCWIHGCRIALRIGEARRICIQPEV